MHVRPEWKENHQRQNCRKVSPMLTSPLLSAETCWKFTCHVLIWRGSQVVSSTSPTLLTVPARHQGRTAASLLHGTRQVTRTAGASGQLHPCRANTGHSGGLRFLATGWTWALLSVHGVSCTSLKQAVTNVLLCNTSPQNLQSTFSVLTTLLMGTARHNTPQVTQKWHDWDSQFSTSFSRQDSFTSM